MAFRGKRNIGKKKGNYDEEIGNVRYINRILLRPSQTSAFVL
jgi:hypothetical protein